MQEKFLRHGTSLLTLVLALTAFSLHCGRFLTEGTLYWDTAKIFTQFRDNLQALNEFGEIAFWFPHSQTGSPGYYHSILGIPSCLNPVFVWLGTVAWILGRLGVVLQTYQPLYVVYFGFLIPLLFLWAVKIFSERLFRSKPVICWILILSAFSPGITFHLTDIGYLEPTAYGLFFGAYFLDFLRRSSLRNYWKLIFSLCLVAISFTHAALYWNVFALPAFVLIILSRKRGSGLKRLYSHLKKVPALQRFSSMVIVLTMFIPAAITYTQGRELVRSSLGMQKTYPFERLAHGNPLESLLISTPGFGFDWVNDRTDWALLHMSDKYHTSHYYLGLLCLAFALYGLSLGDRLLRKSLLICIAISFSSVVLSAHSPVMASLLWFDSPLRSCNHLSDGFFKAGAFLLFIFASASGFKRFIRPKDKTRPLFLIYFFMTCLLAFSIHFQVQGMKVFEDLHFGLLAFFFFVFLILLSWFLRPATQRETHMNVVLLMGLTWIDVSTQSYLYVRHLWNSSLFLNSGWPAYSKIDETRAENGIGIRVGQDPQFYTNLLLMYPDYFQMAVRKFPIHTLPELGLFSDIHSSSDIQNELERFSSKGFTSLGLLNSDYQALNNKIQKRNLRFPNHVSLEKLTFNSRTLSIESRSSQLLFVRDAYSPYWSALLNGKPVPIYRAFYNYKAILVPEGKTRLELRFAPPFISASILIAYSILAGVGLAIGIGPFSTVRALEWKEIRHKTPGHSANEC